MGVGADGRTGHAGTSLPDNFSRWFPSWADIRARVVTPQAESGTERCGRPFYIQPAIFGDSCRRADAAEHLCADRFTVGDIVERRVGETPCRRAQDLRPGRRRLADDHLRDDHRRTKFLILRRRTRALSHFLRAHRNGPIRDVPSQDPHSRAQGTARGVPLARAGLRFGPRRRRRDFLARAARAPKRAARIERAPETGTLSCAVVIVRRGRPVG